MDGASRTVSSKLPLASVRPADRTLRYKGDFFMPFEGVAAFPLAASHSVPWGSLLGQIFVWSKAFLKQLL